jgi:hypothetical protein
VTSSILSPVIPSQAVVGSFIGGLVLLLVVVQIVDFEAPGFKSLANCFKVFSRPLLALFVIITIIRVIRALTG